MRRLSLLLPYVAGASIALAQIPPTRQQTDKSSLTDEADAPELINGAEVINILQISLLPPGNPGRTAWFAADAGLSGITKMKVVADMSTKNSFLLDVQDNGFPPPHPDAVTDDLVVFAPELFAGATATVDVPPFTRLGLFHDVYDETGVFNSGPNGILNDNPEPGTDDAYLSSDPGKSFSVFGAYLMVKYYIADPAKTYRFTNHLGFVTQLGIGYRAFIFMDDDHSPNFDFDDMIIGILPKDCTAPEECDDGNLCNGAEACVDNLCANGSPPVCDDGNPCNGVETCATNACQPGDPVDCLLLDTQCSSAACDPNGAPENCDIVTLAESGSVCDDENSCTLNDACDNGACVGSPLFGLIEWKFLADCLFGPDGPGGLVQGCECSDLNGDIKVDQLDVSEFQILFEFP